MNLNATITEDGVLTLDSGGAKDESVLSSVNEARKKARQTAVMIAEQAGEEVRLVVTDPSGVHVLAVTPEGRDRGRCPGGGHRGRCPGGRDRGRWIG